jgi:hypothetical protein
MPVARDSTRRDNIPSVALPRYPHCRALERDPESHLWFSGKLRDQTNT